MIHPKSLQLFGITLLDMRRRARFLQHTLVQSLGIALTGFRKIDDPVCEYFIGKVATTSKSKRYQGHFERDAHDADRLGIELVPI
jgi:hypothetical protein